MTEAEDEYTYDYDYEDDEFTNDSETEKLDQNPNWDHLHEPENNELETSHRDDLLTPGGGRKYDGISERNNNGGGEEVTIEDEIPENDDLSESLNTDLVVNAKGPLSEPEFVESPKSRQRFPNEINEITGDEALRKKLFETSKRLVGEGENNVNLAIKLEKAKDGLADSRNEINQFRQNLLHGINGGVTDVKNYSHVPLVELLRLRLQESDAIGRSDTDVSFDGNHHRRKSTHSSVGPSAGGSIGGVQKLERQVASERQRSEALEAKLSVLKERLSLATCEARGVDDLKRKIAHLVERSRTERELRSRAERDVDIVNEKVGALSEHIEKLMMHLKHEAISKARALTDQVRTRREVEMLRARNQTMAKRNARKDRTILELKEGAKILEDQLRLMDEKYMELRMKLDWTRSQTERTIKKKDEEAKQLRAKFSLLSEFLPEGETQVRKFL